MTITSRKAAFIHSIFTDRFTFFYTQETLQIILSIAWCVAYIYLADRQFAYPSILRGTVRPHDPKKRSFCFTHHPFRLFTALYPDFTLSIILLFTIMWLGIVIQARNRLNNQLSPFFSIHFFFPLLFGHLSNCFFLQSEIIFIVLAQIFPYLFNYYFLQLWGLKADLRFSSLLVLPPPALPWLLLCHLFFPLY